MALGNYPATVIGNERLTDRLWLLELEGRDVAEDIQPGQFVHMHIPGMDGHILRRPFSVYDADPQSGRFDILYQVVGCGTDAMTRLVPGAQVDMISPIGRRWSIPKGVSRMLAVGAGVGAAPLFMLCKEAQLQGVAVDVVLGAADRKSLVTHGRYKDACTGSVSCSTDDGSFGYHGFCTDVAIGMMDEAEGGGNPYGYVAVCGPEPVMRIVSSVAIERAIACQVSMERRMACGVGACLSCVVETRDGKRRACVDGPVFDAKEVVW